MRERVAWRFLPDWEIEALGRRDLAAAVLQRKARRPMRIRVVVPHWPLDDQGNEALRVCLASLPSDCEKIVVVNQGTGFAVNVARGDYMAVVSNDSRVVEGDVYDLCVPGTVTSPFVLEIGDGHLHPPNRRSPRQALDLVSE